MWLINTKDFSLCWFLEPSECRPYAILSHVWDQSDMDPWHREIGFEDMKNLNQARRKSGWAKIERTCEMARKQNPPLDWAWVDSACIDKSSSAELTEAINSMFSWYQCAAICFVFLMDLAQSPEQCSQSSSDESRLRELFRLKEWLPKCRWFTRGWTLQELVASRSIDFYDCSWTKRGTKSSLIQLICLITGIDQDVLEDFQNLETVPIGRRMSWYAERCTTRIEDIAYCMFGIFNVNMPLLYGEGAKAFIRLQTAIAQQTDDLSLFAWHITPSEDNSKASPTQMYHGIFAQSHKYFKACRRLRNLPHPLLSQNRSFAIANGRLDLNTFLYSTEGTYLVNLFCSNDDTRCDYENSTFLTIHLLKTTEGFVRCRADKRSTISLRASITGSTDAEKVHVPLTVSYKKSRKHETRLAYAFRFSVQTTSENPVYLRGCLGHIGDCGNKLARSLIHASPGSHLWDAPSQTFLTDGSPMFFGVIAPEIRKFQIPGVANDLRIICGLLPRALDARSSPSERLNFEPWIGIIGRGNGLEFFGKAGEQATNLYDILSKYIEIYKSYAPTAAALRYITRDRRLLKELPMSVQLTCDGEADWQTHKTRTQKLRLSIELKSIAYETDLPIHEVTIKLDPISS